jgi:Ca2+-binding EF-hand superfamily protein
VCLKLKELNDEVEEVVRAIMEEVDSNKDGKISLDEFIGYY